MNVAVVNRHEARGGAAKAAYRIFEALRSIQVDASMYVGSPKSHQVKSIGPYRSLNNWVSTGRNALGTAIAKIALLNLSSTLSPALFPSRWPHLLNCSDIDVVNLHWITGEMLSIRDISRISKPVVWTLHDMWAFCGAEHYSEGDRWKEGYNSSNRPKYEHGFDLNRWVWQRKKYYWRHPMHIVTPSHWLGNCVRSSALMGNWPVSVIPNAIDTKFWCPMPKQLSRKKLNLPEQYKIITFCALGGRSDQRKGFDLLYSALRRLAGKLDNTLLVVVGENSSEEINYLNFPVHFTGHVSDDEMLRDVYNASDLLVIPSRQDNLPNAGVEALSCGVPVVAFNVGGLPDIVKHLETGYLAKAFDCGDLANGIFWVLMRQSKMGSEERCSDNTHSLDKCCRKYAEENFSYSVVADKYADLYASLLSTRQ